MQDETSRLLAPRAKLVETNIVTDAGYPDCRDAPCLRSRKLGLKHGCVPRQDRLVLRTSAHGTDADLSSSNRRLISVVITVRPNHALHYRAERHLPATQVKRCDSQDGSLPESLVERGHAFVG